MDVSDFKLIALFILSFSFLGFLVSRLLKRNDVADVGWGIGFIIFSSLFIERWEFLSFKASFVLFLLGAWGLRLAFYIFIRSYGRPEDPRYASWRKQWKKKEPYLAFGKVFLLQSFLLTIIALPIVAIVKDQEAMVGVPDFIGLCLFITGFLFELVADIELYQFKANTRNKGKILNKGVWGLCRHPNYFGEILIWWGFFFFAINTKIGPYTVIGPILISFLLLRVSGVPMLDQLLKKKGPVFKDYVESTPAIIPLKTEWIKSFLAIVITVILLDFLWLGIVMNDFYVAQAWNIARIKEMGLDGILWAAVFVYIFIPLGICVAVLGSSTKTHSQAFFKGAWFGFILYAVYEFTNLSLVRNWPLEMALVDILWGPLLCGFGAMSGYKK